MDYPISLQKIEQAHQDRIDEVDAQEEQIIQLFLKLPKDRQKAILAELWSEFKPEKPKGLRNFNNLPY